MPDNLSVQITADTTELRAKIALAQADLRAFGGETRKLAGDIRAGTGDMAAQRAELAQAAAGYNKAHGEVAKLSAELRGGKHEVAGFADSIKEVNEGLSGILAPIRGTVGGLKEMAEIAGVAFAVEKIAEWTREAVEAGEQALNLSAAIGTTVEKYSEFSGVMKIFGGNAEGSTRTVEKLGQSLQAALGNETSKQRAALNALGISISDIESRIHDPIALIELFRQTWQRFQDTATKSTAFRDLLGRGYETLIPYLRQTNAAVVAAREEFEKTGAKITPGLADKTEETGKAMRTLAESVGGTRNSLYSELQPAIDAIVADLIKLVQATTAQIKPGGELRILAQDIGTTFREMRIEVGQLTSVLPEAFDSGKLFEFKQILVDIDEMMGSIRDAAKGVSDFGASVGQGWKDFDNWIKEHSGAKLFAKMGFPVMPLAPPARATADRHEAPPVDIGNGATAAIPPAESRLIDPMHKLTGVNTELVAALREATKILPTGWHAEVTSGVRSGAHLGGGEHGASEGGGHAIDVALVDPSGRRIKGERGRQPGQEGYDAFKPLADRFLEIMPTGRWGGNFSYTDPMHFGNGPGFAKGAHAGEGMTLPDVKVEAHEGHGEGHGEGEGGAKPAVQPERNLAKEKKDIEDALKIRLAALDLEKAKAYNNRDEIRRIEEEKIAASREASAQMLRLNLTSKNEETAQTLNLTRQKIELDQRFAREGFAIAESRTATEIGSQNRRFDAFKSDLQGQADLRQITAKQAVGFELQRAQQTYEVESAAAQALYGLMNETPTEVERVNKIVETLNADHLKRMSDLRKNYFAEGAKEADKYAGPVKQAFDRVGSSLDSSITGLIDGSKTLQQVWVDLGKTVTGGAVNIIGSTLSKAAAGPVGEALGSPAKPGEGVGDVLGNAASKWAGEKLAGLLPDLGIKAAGDTAGAAASAPILATALVTGATAAAPILSAAVAGGGAAAGVGGAAVAGGAASAVAAPAAGAAINVGTEASGSAVITGAITAAAATTVTGITAAITGSTTAIVSAIEVSAALAETKPSILGTTFSAGGIVPSLFSNGGVVLSAAAGMMVPAAAGGWSVPSSFGTDTVPAMLTPGEMVLPVDVTNKVLGRSGQQQGGSAINVHVAPGAQIFDGPSFSRYLAREGKAAIRDSVRSALRSESPWG